jgi:nucleotide-binding universal stress UspA family protein
MVTSHILVPTDFSAAAEAAFQQALDLAAREQAQVLLLHVLPRCAALCPEGGWLIQAQLEQEWQAEVEQRLQAMAATQLSPIKTLAVWGHPAKEICRVATAYGIDLIVLSTRQRSCLARTFLGSVTKHVVRSAPCSVLIVRTSQLKAARVDQSSVLQYLQQHSGGGPMWWDSKVLTY